MKKSILTLCIALTAWSAFAQSTVNEIGLWQAKLNGAYLTAADMGYTDQQYASYKLFYVFKGGKAFFVMAESKSKVTEANMPNMVKQQFAGEGTYKMYDKLDAMPSNLKEKYAQFGPYEAGLKFLEAVIQGEPMSFIFNGTNRSLRGMNPEMNFELVYLGNF
mgnify:CR=1 FL=1